MAYELKSARFLARDVLTRAISEGDTVVDATAGNGHDTAFLCEAVGAAGRVYAFDVQPEAIRTTRGRLEEAGLLERAALIQDGHEHMERYVREAPSAIVFNLGWLPGGDHQVTTRWATTERAVRTGLEALRPGGVMVICAYPGHAEGERERQGLTGLLSGLDNRRYNVLEQRFLNAGDGAPECFVIQKQESGRKTAR
ncbi:MAG: class I SAM-dependent methyltransferase [Clostridia bacterium]|nr:class I SAM-dependent methyltransferase [Clostridia bacterium]